MRPSTASVLPFLLILTGCATAWADSPEAEETEGEKATEQVEEDAPASSYVYQNDLPRVALVFVAAEGQELNPSTGDKGWETQNAVHIKMSADSDVVYTVHPSDQGALKTAMIYDHSEVAGGGKVKKVAKLSLGQRTSSPGFVVDLGRSLFGLENPWCAAVVGDFQVTLIRGKDDERPVAIDGAGCTDLYTP